ncbi:MAG TPA: penicillin acylase family protein [Steroidobacteraceae bacterium]
MRVTNVSAWTFLLAVVPLNTGLTDPNDKAIGSPPPHSVELIRDDWGVPHLYADREQDAFYGLGYAQAEDRLAGLLRTYLAARGESASVFGAGAVPSDLRARQWMVLERAKAGIKNLEPQLLRDYQQFIGGVQQYMRDHPREVPAWAPPLDPVLPLAEMNSVLLGVNEANGVEDCSRGGAVVAEENRRSPNAGGLSVASNEWVLMPWRTADRVVMHMEDSHVPFQGEIRAFEFRLHAGSLELSGFSADGLVLPVAAHNRNVAWAMTMGGPDVSDCYAVEVDHDHPRRYLMDGMWRQMITRQVTIAVNGGSPVVREFEYTRHNGVLSPVVARRGDTAFVVSSPYMDQAGKVEQQLYRMDQSRNMQEFRQAMGLLGLFSQNVMAGSADGHSLYVRAGRVPIRPAGYNWRVPVPGNTSATAWLGIHPITDLVVVEDPDAGYMTNNNVAPDMMTEQKTVIADRYSPEAFYDIPGFNNARGRRVVQQLSKAYAFSTDDALDLALDEQWEGVTDWIEALRQALNASADVIKTNPLALSRFADRILHFDGEARHQSAAALDYLYWRTAIGNAADVGLSEAVASHRDLSQIQRQTLVTALESAMVLMTAGRVSPDATLGDVYRVGRGGSSWPIGGVKFWAGSEETTTLRAMQSDAPDTQGLRWVTAGQRQPCLTVFSNPIQSFTSAPYGQSDHPESPHYSDQSRLLSERRLKSTYFNREELLKHVESRKTLQIR